MHPGGCPLAWADHVLHVMPYHAKALAVIWCGVGLCAVSFHN